MLVQIGQECHQNAGGAEAALKTVRFPEGLLNRVHLIGCAEALHRLNIVSIGLYRQHDARAHRRAIEQESTCAAYPMLAADMCSRQFKLMPDEIREQHPRFDSALDGVTIYCHMDRH